MDGWMDGWTDGRTKRQIYLRPKSWYVDLHAICMWVWDGKNRPGVLRIYRKRKAHSSEEVDEHSTSVTSVSAVPAPIFAVSRCYLSDQQKIIGWAKSVKSFFKGVIVCVALAVLELVLSMRLVSNSQRSPASDSQMLELKVCTTIPPKIIFKCVISAYFTGEMDFKHFLIFPWIYFLLC